MELPGESPSINWAPHHKAVVSGVARLRRVSRFRSILLFESDRFEQAEEPSAQAAAGGGAGSVVHQTDLETRLHDSLEQALDSLR